MTLARYYAPQDWSNTEHYTLETDGMAGPFYVPTQVWTENRTTVPLTQGWNGPLTEIQTRTLDLWHKSFLPFVGTTPPVRRDITLAPCL